MTFLQMEQRREVWALQLKDLWQQQISTFTPTLYQFEVWVRATKFNQCVHIIKLAASMYRQNPGMNEDALLGYADRLFKRKQEVQ
jgi:hypothetical protein